MLRFSHPAMMGMRRVPTAAAFKAAAPASLAGWAHQHVAFSSSYFTGRNANNSLVSPSVTTAVKEQRMSFISGSQKWLARNRGPSTPPSDSTSSSWGFGQVVQNNTPAAFNSGSTSSTGDELLTPYVREHLMKVYNLLAVAIGLAGAGSAAMIMTPLGKSVPFFVPMIGGFIPLLWLWFRPPANPVHRQALVLAFAGLQGMAIAPIVKATAAAGVLGTALVLTGAVFAGFSAAAFLAPRASLVAFQGPLMGMMLGMFAISILNIFWPTAFAHSIVLYGGLAIFSAFIAVDTQTMIERARCGAGDVAFDALNMFTNVLNIFIRIAEILRNMSN
eukprot:GILI01018085.1.p1 GENE.GILI01018085.1~~GILI01018085.1.p1  ORF type:complete len:347 (-),score=75.35 GILI01018085.1:137-1132(-)